MDFLSLGVVGAVKGLQHDGKFVEYLREKLWILREKSLCGFATAVSRETASSSMLNDIANLAHKAGADWPLESKGYTVESQNDQLRVTWSLIWASLGAVIITEQQLVESYYE